MARLLEKYRKEVVPALMERLGLTNALAVPRLAKIVVSMGVGKATTEKTRLEAAVKDLATITGQHPLITRAKTSISGFKVRQGMPVGCCVTLRGRRMYEFLDRLINVVIPRIRDFRGLTPSFDGSGNYSLGLDEQIVFPEIAIDKLEHVQGMNITIVVRNADDGKALELLSLLGMPFAREAEVRKERG
jgi:large subunit ribosomal protein L5